jgi:Asp-tRNA(Asn)/Glu-tRNA(Gln) amidotransferase A subunit family amidase
MKIMISQPMRGKNNKQIRNERQELIKQVEEKGHEVIDTIFENAPSDEDMAIYMLSQSIRYIGKVDGIVFMKGWERARGCKIEHEVAVEYGKQIFYEN